MTLASVKSTPSRAPIRTTLYAVEGIGKTTFGASAPSPIFIGAEEGFGDIEVPHFPQPETLEDVREAIRTLRHEEHDHKTLVLDTLDWIEPMIWNFICARDGKKDVEDYGYGKGYVAAVDQWRVLFNDLDQLRTQRSMAIVLLAHSWIKAFKNPEGEDYDRFEMKINSKAAGLAKEWSDVVLFANYETFANKDAKTKRVRGVSTGARVCYSQRAAAYDAKNRFSLPESFPLDWNEYASALAAGPDANVEALAQEIIRKAALVGGVIEQKALAMIESNRSDSALLSRINNGLNVRLAERSSEEGAA